MKELIKMCLDIMNIPFVVYGFTVTLWQCFLWSALAVIVIGAVYRIMSN